MFFLPVFLEKQVHRSLVLFFFPYRSRHGSSKLQYACIFQLGLLSLQCACLASCAPRRGRFRRLVSHRIARSVAPLPCGFTNNDALDLMARGSRDAVAIAEGALALLQQLFPSSDSAFLRSCISHHQQHLHRRSTPPPTTTAVIASIVEHVSDKLLESGTADEGHTAREWPRVRWWKLEEDRDDSDEVEEELDRGGGDGTTIASRQDIRSAFDKPSAGADADAVPTPTPTPTKRRRRRRVPDLTTERNLVLYVSPLSRDRRTDRVTAHPASDRFQDPTAPNLSYRLDPNSARGDPLPW